MHKYSVDGNEAKGKDIVEGIDRIDRTHAR